MDLFLSMKSRNENVRKRITVAALATCTSLAPGAITLADPTSPGPDIRTTSDPKKPDTSDSGKAPNVAPQLKVSPTNSGRGGTRGRPGEIEILIDPTEALEKSHQSAQELAPAKPAQPGKPNAASRRNPPISRTLPKATSE